MTKITPKAVRWNTAKDNDSRNFNKWEMVAEAEPPIKGGARLFARLGATGVTAETLVEEYVNAAGKPASLISLVASKRVSYHERPVMPTAADHTASVERLTEACHTLESWLGGDPQAVAEVMIPMDSIAPDAPLKSEIVWVATQTAVAPA
jgi:hypothetical protein